MGIFKDLGFVNRNGKISAADSASLGGKTFSDIVNMKPLVLDKSSTSTLSPSELYNSTTRIPLTLRQPLNEGVWKKFEFVVTNLNPQITSMTSSSINSVSVNLGTLSNYTVAAGTGDVAIDLVFSDYTLLTKMKIVSSNTNNMMPKTWELYIKTSSGYVLSDSGVSYVFSGTANIDMDGGFATEYRLVIKKDWYGNKGNGLLIGSLSFSYTGYTGVSVNGKHITRVSYNDTTKTAVYSDICDTRTLKDIILYGTCDSFTHKLYKDYGTDRWGITEDVDGVAKITKLPTTLTQEVGQGNWIEYQVTATNLEGSLLVNGVEPVLDYTDVSGISVNYNDIDTSTMNLTDFFSQACILAPDGIDFSKIKISFDFVLYSLTNDIDLIDDYTCSYFIINSDGKTINYRHGCGTVFKHTLSTPINIMETNSISFEAINGNLVIVLNGEQIYNLPLATGELMMSIQYQSYTVPGFRFGHYPIFQEGTTDIRFPQYNVDGKFFNINVSESDYSKVDVFKSVSCDTNSLTFTANGSVQELSVNLWSEE